jgi:drug/metabolite transporter (DMT)-like permease
MNARGFDLLVLGVGVAAVSSAAVLIREAEAPTIAIGAYRLGLASLPLIALAALRRGRGIPARDGALLFMVLSGIFLALHFGFWIASVKQTSILTSVVLVTTTPLFIGIAGGPLLGERPGRTVWLALAVAALGTLIMVSEDIDAGGDTLEGDMLALLGAVFAAGYMMTGRRVLGAGSRWLPYITVTYCTAAVALLAAALVSGEALSGYSASTWALLVALAVVPQLIGHTAVNRSLGRLPAIVVSLAILGEPVGATVLAAVFLGEQPTFMQLAGGMVVLTGVALGVRGDVSSVPVPAAD